MLPEPALPDAAFSALPSHDGQPFYRRQTAHEEELDQTPPHRKIVIARRQRPDGVQVLRQHDPGIDGERPGSPNTSNRVAQKVDALCQQSIAPPFQQIGRK
jgi:hypothetical protein